MKMTKEREGWGRDNKADEPARRDNMKQQMVDIAIVTVIFSVAMLFGRLSMNQYGGTWVSFNIPTLTLAMSGIGIWGHLKKRHNRKNRSHK